MSDNYNMTAKAKSKVKSKTKGAVVVKKTGAPFSKKTIRNIFISVIAALILITTFIIIFYLRKKEADRTVKIAFCDISQEMVENIKKEIPEIEGIKIDYSYLNKNDLAAGTVSEKFDLLFASDGELTNSLEKFSEEIPNRFLQTIPNSMRSKKAFPILLNHYELCFYKPVLEKNNLEYPESWSAFVDYLKEASKHVFTPFFCEGKNDRSLLALLGAIVEARTGYQSYNKLIELFKNANSLDDILDVELGKDSEETVTVRLILDMFKDWAVEGLVHPLWYTANRNDALYFMEQNQVGVLFQSLTEHRTVPYSIIKDYESLRFPVEGTMDLHGLISPAVVCLILSNNMNNNDLLKPFTTTDVQSRLSMLTQLGPTQYQSESYDRQADDVRFWAASCKGGNLPDLALAVYQRNEDGLKKMAEEIRQYLKN